MAGHCDTAADQPGRSNVWRNTTSPKYGFPDRGGTAPSPFTSAVLVGDDEHTLIGIEPARASE